MILQKLSLLQYDLTVELVMQIKKGFIQPQDASEDENKGLQRNWIF